MSPVTPTYIPQFRPSAHLRSLFAGVRRKPAIKVDSEEQSRKRREFVLEVMQSGPDAIQSEMDWHSMVYFYPARF